MAICNANDNIAIDKALFCYTTQNKKIWLIGLINTLTKYFRIEAVNERSRNNIEKIIRHNISECNSIITNDFTRYNWINNRNSDYNHIIHIHGQNDLGLWRRKYFIY